jgi:hypothetical protein
VAKTRPRASPTTNVTRRLPGMNARFGAQRLAGNVGEVAQEGAGLCVCGYRDIKRISLDSHNCVIRGKWKLFYDAVSVAMRVREGMLGRRARHRSADQRVSLSRVSFRGADFCFCVTRAMLARVLPRLNCSDGEVLNGRTPSQKTQRSHENKAETQSQAWDG